MQGSISQPKVFISYSWTTSQHERWVIDLAQRLSSDGIIVVLDKWDLKEGQDKHKFMEQMVHDGSIVKVLVICDSGYQAKADDRRGGVGTESQLISKEVYENTAQEKFIPVIREFDKQSKPCMPHFMAGRIFVDLSEGDNFEINYQQLVRNVYGKPLLKRPPIGTPPSYVTDEEQVTVRTTRKLAAIRDALVNDRQSAKGLIADFLETLLVSLEDFRLFGGNATGFDDKVVKNIEAMLPLRDDFIDFTAFLFKYQREADLDQLHSAFEQLISFAVPNPAEPRTEIDFDHYYFFAYELMLYFITSLLTAKRYSEVAYFVNSTYFFRSTYGELKTDDVRTFNRYVRSLDEIRNSRLGLQRVSVTGDLIKQRATRTDIRFEKLQATDLVLHYIVELHGEKYGWFPRTSVHGTRGSDVEFFRRLMSRRHFENIKSILGVTSLEELKLAVSQCVKRNEKERGIISNVWQYNILPIQNVIDIQTLGTLP